MDSNIILNDVDCKVNTIDTEFGEETLINIPKQYKYLSEVLIHYLKMLSFVNLFVELVVHFYQSNLMRIMLLL